GSETVLTPGPDDASPRFSPDGAWIMYIHNHAAYRIPAFGGEPGKLLDNVEDAGWSPDGRQIAFTRFQGADSELGIATLSSGESRIVHQFQNEYFQCPSWSPDGSTIALIRKTTGTAAAVFPSFFFVSVDSGDVHVIKSPLRGGELSTPTWIDGARRILYAIPESQGDIGTMQTTIIGSPSRVLLQDVKSGDARMLLSVQSPVSRLEIASAGRLIFDLLGQRDNLKLFSTLGENAQGSWLTHGSSIDRQPFFSPDGQSIIFTSSRSGDVDLWEVTLKTNALHRLTDNPASDWDPFITPDNKHLVWSSNRSGNFEIWIADRDGASPRQLSHDGYDAENPIITSEGWLLYSSGNPKHPGLFKMRLDGSAAQVLVPHPIAWPDASPDGKYVLYHLIGNALSGDIHVVRVEDGAPVDFHAAGQRARFSGDGRSIAYIRPYGHGIVRQDFPASSGSRVQVLVPDSPDQFIDSFGISADGKRIIATYAQPARSLVLADHVPGIDKR
ncbi:MAG: PD40 domain-containing protein, partial [Acidobacteriales bacterium]|nr:PD40 domain-containing protein [Terriglobales bacterium]